MIIPFIFGMEDFLLKPFFSLLHLSFIQLDKHIPLAAKRKFHLNEFIITSLHKHISTILFRILVGL